MGKYKITVECSETFTVEAPNREAAEDKAIEMACIEGIWTAETKCLDWPENVKDLNRNEVPNGIKFKLKGSSHIFISVLSNDEYGTALVDITNGILYTFDELEVNEKEFDFYRKEDDEDFLGVEVINEGE